MSIELIIGAMFTGKTEDFLSRVRIASIAGYSSLLIKHKNDTRYSDEGIVTHSGDTQKDFVNEETGSVINIISATELVYIDADKYDIIGIDEGQFYPDLIDFCKKWVQKEKRIIISALDGDYLQRPFGEICNIIPLCDTVTKRHGVCMECRREKSLFSHRINKNTDLIDIGAKNKYKSLCRKCYLKLKV